MLVARNEQGDLVSTVEGEPQGRSFSCPACSSMVRLKKGRVIRPHFAHVHLQDCHFFHEQESREHLELKARLYQALVKQEEVQVEVYLPQLNQVADLLVNHHLALEVQCSQLSVERLRERTLAYQRNGYQVRWLLGEKLWLKQRLTALQKQLLCFSQNIGFHYWELDVSKHELRLKYLIYEDIKGRLTYLEKSCSFDGDVLSLLRFPYQSQSVSFYRVPLSKDIQSFIQRQLVARNPRWMRQQELAYLAGENLLTKSLESFYPQVRPVQSDVGFCQITDNLEAFYADFTTYYQQQNDKDYQVLFPPAYYQKTLAKMNESAIIKEKGDF